jgi:hypothetical protein
MVVTEISLIGWLIGNYGQASAVVSAGIIELRRRIERQIERLRDL